MSRLRGQWRALDAERRADRIEAGADPRFDTLAAIAVMVLLALDFWALWIVGGQ